MPKFYKKLEVTLVKGQYQKLNPLAGEVESPEQIYEVFKKIKDQNQETLIGLYLDNDFEVRAYKILSLGTDSLALVVPKQIYEHAILAKSSFFILIHNHPSGDPSPSFEDLNAIKHILEGCKSLELAMVDFIIVGDLGSKRQKNYWSWFQSSTGNSKYSQENIHRFVAEQLELT